MFLLVNSGVSKCAVELALLADFHNRPGDKASFARQNIMGKPGSNRHFVNSSNIILRAQKV